jgi:hypothetical protein
VYRASRWTASTAATAFTKDVPEEKQSMAIDSTNRKLFWILFTVLSFGGWFLPFGWAVAEMFLSLFVSWWLVYRSGIF